MNKKLIKLTESDLHRIVKEGVKKVLRESLIDDYDEAEKRLRLARSKGDANEIIAAAKEWNRLKVLAKSEIDARKENQEQQAEINYANKQKDFIKKQLDAAEELILFFQSGFGVYSLVNNGSMYVPYKKKGKSLEDSIEVLKTKIGEAENIIDDFNNPWLKDYCDTATKNRMYEKKKRKNCLICYHG